MKGIGLMLRRRGLLVAATVVASLGFASAASAATFTVNDTRDFPQSPTASSGACVSTASTCTLRAAVQASNENGGSNTINVPAGTYLVDNASSNATPCTGGGDESINDLKVNDCNNSTSITIIGAGSGNTVLNANGVNRLFTLYPNGSLDLQKMTLENGDGGFSTYGSNINTSYSNSDDGGAVLSEGHFSAESVTFTGNNADGGSDDGGAVAWEDVSGSTGSLTASVFQNNSGEGGAVYTNAPNDVTLGFDLFQANNAGSSDDGGAIYGDTSAAGLTMNFDNVLQNVAADYGGGVYWDGTGALNVSNSLFTQNQTTTSGDGGGIFIDAGNNVNVSNTSFDGNSAEDNGGGLSDGDAGSGGSNALTLTSDKFSNNVSNDEGGGAAVQSGNATTTVITSTEFDGNSATSEGGGIYWEEGVLELKGDSFVLNSSADGGALSDEASSGAPPNKFALIAGDTTMSRNTASTAGGGIYNASEFNPLYLINDTIAFNNAPAGEGGGVYNAAKFVNDNNNVFGVENTTVAENSGGDCSSTFQQALSPAPLDQGNNNDSDQTCFGGVGGPNDKTGVNPLLANPANNGGPAVGGPGDTVTIQTDAEQSNSPLIDAGNNNGCPSVDERGVARPQGKACDIGAFEFGANPTTTSTTTTGVTTTTSKTTTTTKTTTTHKPPHKHKKCKKGHHRSHGKCVKNKKHKKHHKKHKK